MAEQPNQPNEIDAALAELREMFPKMFCYFEQHVQASWTPTAQKPQITMQVDLQIDSAKEGVIVATSGATVEEAMRKVREWKAANQPIRG